MRKKSHIGDGRLEELGCIADGAATAPETKWWGRGICIGTRRPKTAASRQAPAAGDSGCDVEPRAASGEVWLLDSPSIPANSGAEGPNSVMMRRPRRLGGGARRGQHAESDESRATQPRVSIRKNRGEQRGAGGGGREAEGGRRSPARHAVGRRGDARATGGRRATCGRKTRGARGAPTAPTGEGGVRGYLGAPLE
jgi:hypothetical protein